MLPARLLEASVLLGVPQLQEFLVPAGDCRPTRPVLGTPGAKRALLAQAPNDTYDSRDRLVSCTDALGHVEVFTYNDRGNLSSPHGRQRQHDRL